MTSLIVWSAADTHGPASINIATDSRISWGGSHFWDQGKKVFASSTQPIIIGYLGDVLFPSVSIPAVLERIDRQLLDASDPLVVVSAVRALWRDYPEKAHGPQRIFLAYRLRGGMQSRFGLTVMSHAGSPGSRWSTTDIAIPETSSELVIDGSGAVSVRKSLRDWKASNVGGTSRAIFSAFVESVTSGNDPRSGGSPQLGSIYRIGNGRLLGVVHNNQRYYAGAHILGREDADSIHWRNALFEVTDGRLKRRRIGAQLHTPRE